MAAVRGTAVGRLWRCVQGRATDRFPSAWTYGFDPLLPFDPRRRSTALQRLRTATSGCRSHAYQHQADTHLSKKAASISSSWWLAAVTDDCGAAMRNATNSKLLSQKDPPLPGPRATSPGLAAWELLIGLDVLLTARTVNSKLGKNLPQGGVGRYGFKEALQNSAGPEVDGCDPSSRSFACERLTRELGQQGREPCLGL